MHVSASQLIEHGSQDDGKLNGEHIEMIRDQWYSALKSKEVGTHPDGVTRMSERLVFRRARTPLKTSLIFLF